MMHISDISGVKNASDIKKRRRVGDGGLFASFLDAAGDAADAASVSTLNAPSAASSLFALQEVSEFDVERKKAFKRGHSMLDALERLRRQLIVGEVPHSTLQSLASELSAERAQIADPQLLEILDDIELRLAVELAKLEMASDGNRGSGIRDRAEWEEEG